MSSSSQRRYDNIIPACSVINQTISCEGSSKDLTYYLPLYKAALKGDLECARRFLNRDPNAVTATITRASETALHLTAAKGCNMQFVEELVHLMPVEALAMKNYNGNTALSLAAIAGATKAGEVMVRKNRDLTQIRNNDGRTPLLRAAQYGHKDMVWYLLSVTRDEDPSPYRGQDGARLLNAALTAGFYDVALYLLQHYPQLATARDRSGESALHVLARTPSAFASGSQLAFWQHCIYSCVHVEQDDIVHHIKGSMEDISQGSRCCLVKGFRYLNRLFWNVIKELVPNIKQVYNTKLMNIETLELVKCLCERIFNQSSSQIVDFFIDSHILSIAAKFGTIELIIECLQSYPDLMWMNTNDKSIFHIAVEHRQEKVFNFIYGLNTHKNVLASHIDKSNANNILHMAGKLAPSSQLNYVSGAALQMQRELQWFKEVEKIVQPSYKELENSEGKTPKVVFTEEHKDLVKQGEKWMKDTATSCMVVATLIATVVFAAAFSVPGGNNNDKGVPNFLQTDSFMIFAISDALALFSSSASVLMFLSILTSRYAEEDFLDTLPKRLIIGLATLFFSIATMMLAFSATLFIVLGYRLAWVAIPIALLACVPVILFALLQFPLFVEIVISTYGSGIFHRRSKYQLY